MERSPARDCRTFWKEKRSDPQGSLLSFRLTLFSPYHFPVSVKVTARVFPLVEVIRPKLVESKV